MIDYSHYEKKLVEEVCLMDIADLPAVIVADFQKYTAEKSDKIAKAVRKRSAGALDEVIANSPVRKRIPKSGVLRNKQGEPLKDNLQPGAYKAGWIKYISTARPGRTEGYIRNKTNYQLVHLLELGHDIKRKGAIKGHVAPIPHVIPAEDKARAALNADIDTILRE